MKKFYAVLGCLLLLSGCGTQETFETISDEPVLSVSAAAAVQIQLPQEAAVPSMEADDGTKLYMCDGFSVTVQTMQGGDLNKTIREISGYSRDALTVMQTEKDGMPRYECVWSAVGEGESQICRAVILDDGVYHYAVTVMADYVRAGDLTETWQEILSSVSVSID